MELEKNRKGTLAVLFLLLGGLLQMVGDISQSSSLELLGAAWGASPAPKVFISSARLEPFSSRFFFSWQDKDHKKHRIRWSPAVASHLKGPYNRRCAYGYLVTQGPFLTQDGLFKNVYEQALVYMMSSHSSFLQEMGIDPTSVQGKIQIEMLPKSDKDISPYPGIKKVPVETSYGE